MFIPHVYLEIISISPKRRALAGWALPTITSDAAVLQVYSIEVIEEAAARIPVSPWALLQLIRLTLPLIAWTTSSGNGWLCWLFAFA